MKKEEMDFYQKYDMCGSEFLYLRGWVHIERLSEEELEILKESYEDMENEQKFAKAYDILYGLFRLFFAVREFCGGRFIQMSVIEIILVVLEALCSVALIGVVLLQSGKEAGLSGALAGSSDSYLSKNKKGGLDQILASSTKWIAGVWVLLTLFLSFV